MKLGFRIRLILVFSLLVAGIAVFFSVYFPARAATAVDSALETRARGLAVGLASLVATSLDLGGSEAQTAQDLVRLKDDPDYRYAVVVKADGKVFARHPERSVAGVEELLDAPESERISRSGDLLHVSVPMRNEQDELLGVVTLGFSRAALLHARQRDQRAALLVSLIVFAIGVSASYAMTRPLVKVSGELAGAAREQEASMGQGAAAVEETRRTMDMLVGSAQQIADSCSAVLGNAESTLKAAQHITDCITELDSHAEKVTEILATIMSIADRTDLLALNAALEGTKAGEAGKGFTLVAAEMRRLAENVMESVVGIRRLMKDVRSASTNAVQASVEGIKLSEETTRSAREIALVTQQQRRATEQVRHSMDEMTQLLNHTMASIWQTTRTAQTLAGLAAGRIGGGEATALADGSSRPVAWASMKDTAAVAGNREGEARRGGIDPAARP